MGDSVKGNLSLLLEQYEMVRASGFCNMFAYACVMAVANDKELYLLASLTREEYHELLQTFWKKETETE